MSWTVNLNHLEAVHTSNLKVHFICRVNGWEGKAVEPVPKELVPIDVPWLIREAGE